MKRHANTYPNAHSSPIDGLTLRNSGQAVPRCDEDVSFRYVQADKVSSKDLVLTHSFHLPTPICRCFSIVLAFS